MYHRAISITGGLIFSCLTIAQSAESWKDVTLDSGIESHATSWNKFTDLNNDGWPDVVIFSQSADGGKPIVYLHSGNPADKILYSRLEETGLPWVYRGDTVVFADINNDGNQDAVIGRYLDIYQDNYLPPKEEPSRTAWLPGNGDGSFSEPNIVTAAQLATTRAIAVGDVNQDGLPDLFIGNWYEKYFSGYEAFANDLLLQYQDDCQIPQFARWSIPDENRNTSFDKDLGGRPTYGVAMPILEDGLPMLLELNYGRRWNRLYRLNIRGPLRNPPGNDLSFPPTLQDSRARAEDLTRQLQGDNIAIQTHVDGDGIRHGKHPVWPTQHAEDRPRSKRPDEPPFRANGNTFDSAIGDIDNDGDFDLFLSTIIHSWAGDSSDRSRFLVNQLKETGKLDFISPDHLNVDRIPELPPEGEPLQPVHTQYNQGDIYVELADFNNDGRLDLILCSSDYPDPPPHDERLRLYFQQSNGQFLDVTRQLGVDHVGAGMPSLGDIDGDGDLDLLIGQSFNRLPAEQRIAAAIKTGVIQSADEVDKKPLPSIRLFKNESGDNSASLILHLTGDPAQGVTRDAYGTIVRVTADLDGDSSTPPVTQIRQVLGPYGHSGKQHMFSVHFGLGKASKAELVEILWPGPDSKPTTLQSLPSGSHQIHQSFNN